MKVAMECAYAPFNWAQTDDKNGAVPISSEGSDGLYANGYDVQIAKYIANALGLKLEIYAIKWDSLIPGVKAVLTTCRRRYVADCRQKGTSRFTELLFVQPCRNL
ncbi:MAG: transporter substrate-binding domain-containing protein [Christensenellales bacterium]